MTQRATPHFQHERLDANTTEASAKKIAVAHFLEEAYFFVQ